MIELARGYFRKSVFKTYRYLKHPRRLKSNAPLRWFSRHFLNKRVWKPTRYTFAGGTAVGCFLTVQLIPVQMPLAVILAGAFRVNIPIALIVCWISNPVTLVPIGIFEKKLGEWLLNLIGDPATASIASLENPSLDTILAYARYVYAGGLLAGALLAPIGYIIAYAGWTVAARFTRHPVHSPGKANPPSPP